METERKFKTKTGYCHILPEKIVLTRDGLIGNISKLVVGNKMYRILLIYTIIAIVFIYYTIDNFLKNDIYFAVFFGLFAIYLIYGIISSFNNTTTPVIDRKTVNKVIFKKGIPGISRARFEVIFTDKKGRTKKRLIMLPGTLTDSDLEKNEAYKTMKEEKLI